MSTTPNDALFRAVDERGSRPKAKGAGRRRRPPWRRDGEQTFGLVRPDWQDFTVEGVKAAIAAARAAQGNQFKNERT
jgi:hypothetical protein